VLIELEGHLEDKIAQAFLTRAARAAGETEPLMRTLANQQFRSTLRNFQKEAFGEDAWPKLQESTMRRHLYSQDELVANYAVKLRRFTVKVRVPGVNRRTGRPTAGRLMAKRDRRGRIVKETRRATTAEVDAYRSRTAKAFAGTPGTSSISGVGRRRGGANILHPTGRHLMQTLYQSHTIDEARVATPNPWAFVHNFGAPMPHYQMPRRTFLGFTEEDHADIVAACQRYLDKSVLA